MSAPVAYAGVDVADLVDPGRYASGGYPHDAWARLRAEAPVAWFEPPGLDPFWAITKHADVLEISKQPVRFSSAQGITLRPAGFVLPPSEILVLLDPPKHGPMRRVANAGFTPRAVRSRRDDIERIAVEIVDDALPVGGHAEHPGDDPEYRQPGESPGQTIKRARGELHRYFDALIADRRRDPRDDLVSELVAAEIDGAPLTAEQLVAYCELLVEAGNETTRNAISGGLLALSEHPGEWEKLRADPDLLPDAVEEILRWVSPISHFTRIATEDYELRGVTIRAGDMLALYYASANRDEDVFDDPFSFRIDRRPNPHLAFGFGQHFCMGAHVARVEIETIFRHLVRRVESFEVSGPVERLSSITNGSLKHLPIRHRTKEQRA